MTDRELLELAAKAVGLSLEQGPGSPPEKCLGACLDGGTWDYWNPLDDDGDALRLAVKIGLRNYASFEIQPSCVQATCIDTWEHCEYEEFRDQDPYAATRLAIVRAAAEIGRRM